jgi:dTDP-4-dehydrorhamnose 3,5-epimerase-like enzyme
MKLKILEKWRTTSNEEVSTEELDENSNELKKWQMFFTNWQQLSTPKSFWNGFYSREDMNVIHVFDAL